MNPHVRRAPGPGLLLALAGMAVFGALVHWSQNVAGHTGGAISPEKVFWLCYALSVLFVVPLFLWRDRRVAPAVRGIFAAHLLFWAARAVFEGVLMFGFHAWIPPYGIAHDVLAIALLATLAWRRREALLSPGPATRTALGFMLLLGASLVFEIAFAALFYDAAAHQTSRTWFADTSARFALINALTRAVDLAVYPLLGLVVFGYYRLAPRPGG